MRRGSRWPNGARLTANPLALLEEAREGALYCAEIGQYSKIEQKGLAFLLPKLDKQNVTLVCTSSEPLGNLAAEGKFDAALLAQLAAGAVMLPPLRKRREDIPPLDRALLARSDARTTHPTPLLAALPPAALTALSNAYWPGNLDHLAELHRRTSRCVRGEITTEHVKRVLGEAASPNPSPAPEITARFFELPLREAREAFERIYFEQLLGREQSNMSKVAERAGLERTHLYRKLKQLNIRFSRRGDDTRCAVTLDDHRARGLQAHAGADRRRDRRRVRRHRHEPAVHAAQGVQPASTASPLTPANVYGVLSVMFWALIVVVTLKYLVAHHARRQQRRGRHPRADGAGVARPRAPRAPALVARRLRHLRRGDVLRRRHDHAGDLGALARSRASRSSRPRCTRSSCR